MTSQLDSIISFCKDSKWFMVKYPKKGEQEFGKIIKNEEINEVDISSNEIFRSIEYKNDNTLFVYDLKPTQSDYVDNPLTLLVNNLEDAKIIETVYPYIFTWAFDGVSIKAYAIVPSGCPKSNSTISRYGGTEKFIKILRHHLNNIRRLNKGGTPDYNFSNINYNLNDSEMSIGSINTFNKMYCVPISTNLSYVDVLNRSINNNQSEFNLTILDMKYWAREINPDILTETKHFSITETIPLDNCYETYPPCIKALMSIKDKGNLNRYKLARFLLSVHSPSDAKFVYLSVLSEDEKEHIKHGNCATQWNYICNNIKRYSCPTCSELRTFCDRRNCKLVHPIQNIKDKIEINKGGKK